MKKSKSFDLDFLAGDEGFEPSQTESESVVLPLHKSPSDLIIITEVSVFVNSIFKIFKKVFRLTPCA